MAGPGFRRDDGRGVPVCALIDEDPFAGCASTSSTLRGMGIDPYPVRLRAHATRRPSSSGATPGWRPGPRPSDRVRVAGRIRAMRNSGMFIDLHDASGKIQVFSHKDHLLARSSWRCCGCSTSAI